MLGSSVKFECPGWRFLPPSQVMIIFVCTLILVAHSNAQPYKNTRINLVETVYLLLLSTLALLQQWENEATRDLLCVTFLIAASIHTVLLSLYKVGRFFNKKRSCVGVKKAVKRKRYGSFEEPDLESSVEPEVQKRRDILDTIFGTSDESGLDTSKKWPRLSS